MINIKYIVLAAFIVFSCKNEKRYHSEEIKEVLITVDTTSYESVVVFERAKLDEKFKTPHSSPLSDIGRSGFDGLNYFPVDTLFKVNASLERTPDEQPFLMATTTDRKNKEVKYGILHFMIHGKKLQLSVFRDLELNNKEGYKDYLFLPFTDETNGSETYGGGRYLDLRIPEGENIVVDFNKAYNPYCAYNKKYSCPIVPSENDLEIEVRAGVKRFK